METPLKDAIEKYLEKRMIPLHTPGHKGRGLGVASDLTELPGLDNLLEPTGVIAQAEHLTANLFGAKQTAFLVNGASSGIMASILAFTKPGDKLLIPRNAHRSVYSAMVLTGIEPVYLMPDICSRWKLPLGIQVEVYKEAILREKPKAIVLINPSYEGIAPKNLGEVIRFARERGVITIIDEAHGSLFPFSHKLPSSGLELGADLIIHGTHKTFGSLTQTGLLHLGTGSALGFTEVRRSLSLIQSTSPSYILLASIDQARAEFQKNGIILLEKLVAACEKTTEIISRNKGIDSLYKEVIPDKSESSYNIDVTKIVVRASDMGLDGFQLSHLLRKEHFIEPEMAQSEYCLLLAGINTTEADLDSVAKAFDSISSANEVNIGNSYNNSPFFPSIPPRESSPRDSYNAPGIVVALKKAVGRVVGQLVCPYPPGIPVLYPGEMVTLDIVEFIEEQLERGASVHGLEWDSDKEVGIRVIDN